MKSPANPYIGPRAFLEGDHLYGRDRELADLIDLLIADRIVLLYSPSGAGKSSLLQAGLIPAMKARGFKVPRAIRVNATPPQGTVDNRYAFSMMASLHLEGQPADPRQLTLNQYLDADPKGELLIFDQFEEILTTDPLNLDGKRRFFQQVGDALRARGRWALFAMREDFVYGLDPYLRYIPTRLSNTFRLGLLSYESSLDAMREPAAKAGVKFLDQAVHQIADDLRKVNVVKDDGSIGVELGEFIEPVQLQVVCLRRWEDLPEGSKEIAKSAQPQIGSTALADYYSATVAKAGAETGLGERTIRDWFEDRLITKLHTRGQVLMGHEESEGLSNQAIKPLMDAYLVRSDQRLGSVWLELAHDRLIGPVRTSNDAFKLKLSPLQREAELWNDQGRPPDHLIGKESLAAREEWARTNTLNSTEQDFLKASRAAEEERLAAVKRQQEDLRKAKILQRLTVALVVALLMAVGVVFLAIWERNNAVQEKVSLNRVLADYDLEKANGLWKGENPAEALAFLARGIEGQPEKASEYAEYFKDLKVPSAQLEHGSAVERIVFSGDGNTVMTMSKASSQVWDVRPANRNNGKSVGLSAASNGVLSPDGTRAALFDSGNISFWDVKSGKLWERSDKTGSFDAVDFAGDAQHIFTGPQEVRKWDIDQKDAPPESAGFGGNILFAAFSPSVALGMQGNAPLSWRPASGVISAGFPDSFSSKVGCPGGQMSTPAALNRDGSKAAFIAGKNVYVWSTSSNGTVPTLNKMMEDPCSLGFTPDGQKVLVIGNSQWGLWDFKNPVLAAVDHDSPVVFQSRQPVFAEVGPRQILLRDVNTGQQVARVLTAEPLQHWALGVSPDGKTRTLATAAGDGKQVLIWDVSPSVAPSGGAASDLAALARAAGGIDFMKDTSMPVDIAWKDRMDLANRPGVVALLQAKQ